MNKINRAKIEEGVGAVVDRVGSRRVSVKK